jgi:hypothetical protein
VRGGDIFSIFKREVLILKTTQSFSEKELQGYEVSVLVLFANHIDGIHNNKFFSRCISQLILVINEDQAELLHLPWTVAQIIPVYGKRVLRVKRYCFFFRGMSNLSTLLFPFPPPLLLPSRFYSASIPLLSAFIFIVSTFKNFLVQELGMCWITIQTI